MKISGINNVSFGQIKKCAAQRAIESANGNYQTLEGIKKLVEGQMENDKYDIMPIPMSTFGYMVVRREDAHHEATFYNLDDAAGYSTLLLKQYYIKDRTTPAKQAIQTPYEKLANKILEMCEG